MTGDVLDSRFSTVPATVLGKETTKRRRSSVWIAIYSMGFLFEQRKLIKVRSKLPAIWLNFHGRPFAETRVCSRQISTTVFKIVKEIALAK